MRSYLLTLWTVFLLGLNPCIAGTLEGDWFIESVDNAESTVRNAFSLAQSSPEESTNATLGIRRSESDKSVELYLVISTASNGDTCQYDVVEADIDSKILAISGQSQATEISNIKTTPNDQNRFWNLFRRGTNLTITVNILCDQKSKIDDQQHSFIFSLKGSSAAYRFVAPKVEKDPNRFVRPKEIQLPKVKAQDSQDRVTKSKETFNFSDEDEDSPNPLNLILVLIIALILVFWSTLRNKKRKAKKPKVKIEPSLIVDDFITHPTETVSPAHTDISKEPRAEKVKEQNYEEIKDHEGSLPLLGEVNVNYGDIVIEGEIETLKKLKKVFSENGITRFSSIADINSFLHGYDNEVRMIPEIVRLSFEEEQKKLRYEVSQLQQQYDNLKSTTWEEIYQEIQGLEHEIYHLKKICGNSYFKKILNFHKKNKLIKRKSYVENNSDKLIENKTNQIYQELNFKKNILDDLNLNKDKVITDRCNKSVQELERVKEVIDGLYSVIAGAVGESAVLQRLSILSGDFYLINDFSTKFDPPIYNKKEGDRIYSVQIDHLLICKSGVFLLETKNWSKKSLKNIDLRSPVQQVQRTSYAMFTLLNGESGFSSYGLDYHHWGNKKIPVRNVLVMTNAKPKQEFKYVKIVPVDQLVGYIQYFEEILSSAEAKNLFNYLKNMKA